MKSSRLIWILEDDPSTQFVYSEVLGVRHQTRTFADLASFRAALAERGSPRPALVITDLRLPDGYFLDFLIGLAPEARTEFPFLVVSSLDDLDVLRVCFEKGAADYLTKPFKKAELIVKVERLLTEGAEGSGERPEAGSRIVLDPVAFTVSFDGKTSDSLTAKEFQILAAITRAEGWSLSKEALLERVWGGTAVSGNALDVHMVSIRKKIASLGLDLRFVPPNHHALKVSGSASAR